MACKDNLTQNQNSDYPVDNFMSEFLHFVQEDYQNCIKYSNDDKHVTIQTDILTFNSENNGSNFTSVNNELQVLSEDLSLSVDGMTIPSESIAIASNEIVLSDNVDMVANNLVETKAASINAGNRTVPTSADGVTSLVEYLVHEPATCTSHVVAALHSTESATIETDGLSLVSVCPDLNSLVEATCSENTVFEDIELYLECSDDDEWINHHTCLKSQHGNFSLHAGALSSPANDMQLKISFPAHPPEHEHGFRCSSCKHYFTSEESLKTHVKLHHKEVFCCQFCPYNTKSEKFFTTHNRSKHNFDSIYNSCTVTCANEEQYEVSQCVPTADTVAVIVASDHTGQIETLVVDKKCTTKETAQHETMPIVSITAHQCELCSYSTSSITLLKIHMHTMHNPSRDIYDCNKCEFTCKQKRTLDMHSNIHKNRYNFICEKCKKKFISKSALTRHCKTHLLTRAFACDMTGCNKSFKVQGALTDHKKKVHKAINIDHSFTMFTVTHDDGGIKKTNGHVANINPLSDKSRSHRDSSSVIADTNNSQKLADLNEGYEKNQIHSVKPQHSVNTMSINSNAMTAVKSKKSFVCPYEKCDKRFRDNFNLECHVNKHTGCKQNTCPQCDYRCIQKASLDHHLKVKHPV